MMRTGLGPLVTRRLLAACNFGVRSYTTKTQVNPTDSNVKFNLDLINHLERTSLVDFGNEEAILRLEEAVKFAEILFQVDTTGVQPLYSVLEQESIHLRSDEVGRTNRKDILMNVPLTEEDYIVAPPGNIPLEQSKPSVFSLTYFR